MAHKNIYIHRQPCRCRHCNPPPTAGEIIGGLVFLGILSSIVKKLEND